MDVNLFACALRAKFLDEMRTRRHIGSGPAPTAPFRCHNKVLIRVPIRDIEDDFAVSHRNNFVERLRALLDELPRFDYDERRGCIHSGGVYYRSEIRFGTDAGTPLADMRRAIDIWVSVKIDALPHPPEEIVWQTVGDAMQRHPVPHYAPAKETSESIDVDSFAAQLAASMGEGASLTPRRFNSEGGFSDN